MGYDSFGGVPMDFNDNGDSEARYSQNVDNPNSSDYQSTSDGGKAVKGLGMFMGAIGTAAADWAQADAERENASWFREQGAFAAKSGQRQLDIFDRQTKILTGDQMSAFAKAGIDTGASSLFLAKTILFRQQEHGAIKAESDFNVRQTQLRALAADRAGHNLDVAGNNALWSMPFNIGGSLV